MQDAQFPPDAEDANAAQSRRVRLSDAEIVATTRLDMFGDGALKQSLSHTTRGVEDGHDDPAPAPTDAGPRLSDGAQPRDDQPAPALTPEPPPLPLPAFRHRFDAVSDPAPGGHAVGAPEHTGPDTSHALPGPPSILQEPEPAIASASAEPAAREPEHPDASPAPELGSPSQAPAPDPESDRASAPAEARTEQLPILSALDAAERRAGEEEPREAAAPPTAFGPAMMMPPGSPEQDGAAGPLSERPRFREELIRGPAGSGTAPDAEPAAEAEPQATEPDVIVYPEAPEEPAQLAQAPPPSEPPAPFSEPPPPFSEPASAPAEPYDYDAAAKIAAEADATAEALENLKRLLANKLPDLEFGTPAGQLDRGSEYTVSPAVAPPLQMHPDPPGFATMAPAPMLPLPVPPARSSGRSVYLLGFLAGLGLSLMAGAALFLFIMTNGG